MTPAEKNVHRIELQKLEEKIELMRLLVNREGFFKYYFKEIKNYPSREKAFNAVNELYYSLFGEFRYSDYQTFRQILSKNNKK